MRNVFYHFFVAALCLTVAGPAFAQTVTFDKVKIRFQPGSEGDTLP